MNKLTLIYVFCSSLTILILAHIWTSEHDVNKMIKFYLLALAALGWVVFLKSCS